MTYLLRRHMVAALCGLIPVAQAQPPDLARAARAEGRIASVGMPDDWANWRTTWADLLRLHGLAHVDTDMSSVEQIPKMEAERANAPFLQSHYGGYPSNWPQCPTLLARPTEIAQNSLRRLPTR